MPHLLPTITSMNRHATIRRRQRNVSRREPPPPVGGCNHRVNMFGGRCPQCYRDAMRAYSTRLRRPARAPRPLPLPRLNRAPLPIFRHPRPPRPNRAPLSIWPPRPPPPPVFRPSSFLDSLGLRLPGRCIILDEKEEICPICHENYEKDMNCQLTPCQHKFHAWCFSKWFTMRQNCPMCRRSFT